MSQVVAALLIAHGSRQEEANRDLRELALRLGEREPGTIVEASFLELAEPGIIDAGRTCVERGANLVLMVPYFLSAGVHLRRDLSAARTELSALFPEVEFRLAPALGPHPLLDQIVVERIRELGEPR